VAESTTYIGNSIPPATIPDRGNILRACQPQSLENLRPPLQQRFHYHPTAILGLAA
jgi:hypothetical protein